MINPWAEMVVNMQWLLAVVVTVVVAGVFVFVTEAIRK